MVNKSNGRVVYHSFVFDAYAYFFIIKTCTKKPVLIATFVVIKKILIDYSLTSNMLQEIKHSYNGCFKLVKSNKTFL